MSIVPNGGTDLVVKIHTYADMHLTTLKTTWNQNNFSFYFTLKAAESWCISQSMIATHYALYSIDREVPVQVT